MKKRNTSAALALALAAGLLTACGAGSKLHSSSRYAAMETTAAAMEMGDFNAMSFDTAAGMPTQVPETKSASESLTSSSTIQPASTSRKLIRNVDLNVETTEFDTLTRSISQSVTDLGGYLESSDISGTSISDSGQLRSARLTARIPADRLDGFIEQVNAQGNITSRSESTQDVTLQYSDVESRKKSLTIEQERLWALLEKADSVDAVIALESRLSEIRYQLESMESQLRTYDNQVDYSTIYLSVREVKVFTPTSPDSVMVRMQKGFQKSLNDVGNGLLNFSVWFVSSLPVLLVLAVILFLLLTIGRLILSHSSRKSQHRKDKALKADKAEADTPPETDNP